MLLPFAFLCLTTTPGPPCVAKFRAERISSSELLRLPDTSDRIALSIDIGSDGGQHGHGQRPLQAAQQLALPYTGDSVRSTQPRHLAIHSLLELCSQLCTLEPQAEHHGLCPVKAQERYERLFLRELERGKEGEVLCGPSRTPSAVSPISNCDEGIYEERLTI